MNHAALFFYKIKKTSAAEQEGPNMKNKIRRLRRVHA
jgi:hypothetical protein